MVQRTVSR